MEHLDENEIHILQAILSNRSRYEDEKIDSTNNKGDVQNITTLSNLIIEKNYSEIHKYLTSTSHNNNKKKVDVDALLIFGNFSFSGLDWAFLTGDWKMAAIFFIHGAKAKFDLLSLLNKYHFRNYNMHMRPTQTSQYGLGVEFLYILRLLDDGVKKINLRKDYITISSSLYTLEEILKFSSSDLESYVLTSLNSLRKMGLNEDVTLHIVERAVLSTLWNLLESFATSPSFLLLE